MNRENDTSGNRIKSFFEGKPDGYVIKPASITADEARAMIDAVLRDFGLDPSRATDENGWRRMTLGNARGYIGVVPWKTGQDYLVAFAPLINIPPDVEMSDFYKKLLELNHQETQASRFSIDNNTLYVSLVRPITGLDVEEVEAAISALLITADSAERWLSDVLDQVFQDAMVPLEIMPRIRLTPKEIQRVGAFLAGCDQIGREIISYLLERWQKSGNYIDTRNLSIGFNVKYGDYHINLAGIRHSLDDVSQMMVLGWESLRRYNGIPSHEIDQYQKTIRKVGNLRITESSAHLDIDKRFNKNKASTFINALIDLANSINHEIAEKPASATPGNIQATLDRCDERVQDIYKALMEGWEASGGTIQCPKEGRIYLKFQTGVHDFGEYGPQTHKFNLAVLAAPKGKRGAHIDIAWNLSRGSFAYLDTIPEQVERFETIISNLPGFEQEGTVTRVLINTDFQQEHTRKIMKALQDLIESERKLNPVRSIDKD